MVANILQIRQLALERPFVMLCGRDASIKEVMAKQTQQ